MTMSLSLFFIRGGRLEGEKISTRTKGEERLQRQGSIWISDNDVELNVAESNGLFSLRTARGFGSRLGGSTDGQMERNDDFHGNKGDVMMGFYDLLEGRRLWEVIVLTDMTRCYLNWHR